MRENAFEPEETQFVDGSGPVAAGQAADQPNFRPAGMISCWAVSRGNTQELITTLWNGHFPTHIT
jgi:hypothetical protein